MSRHKLTQSQARLVRWRILKTLYMGRPYPVTESLMLTIICDTATPIGLRELRAETQYLADKDKALITIRALRHETDNRDIKMTARGIDFVEYNAPDVDGIDRPRHAAEI